MTLLFVDGCQGGDITTKWDSGSTGTRTTTAPRNPGTAYYVGSTAYKTITPSAELYTSGAFFWPASGTHVLFAVYADTGTTQHITITRNASLRLEVRLGSSSGTVIATGTTTLANSTFYHVEARYVIHDTVGVVQIRINGAATNEINFSGDTRNGGTSTNLDRVAYVATNSSHKYTDVVISNALGSVNNTWMGNTTVATLVPNGNGFYSEGDEFPSGTTLRYTLVDDLPYSLGDGIYTYYNTRDSWFFTNLPYGTAVVKALQFNQHVQGSGGGTTPMRRLIRVSGTDYYGTSYTPVYAVFDVYSEVLELSPATSTDWTPTTVDALEAGIGGTFVFNNFDSYISAMSVEALIEQVPSLILVSVNGGGTILVDTPNDVQVNGGGTITVGILGQLGGAIVVNGGGTVVTSADGDPGNYPNPEPTEPTLGTPGPDEVAIPIYAEEYPDPVLVDGVPVDWEPV